MPCGGPSTRHRRLEGIAARPRSAGSDHGNYGNLGSPAKITSLERIFYGACIRDAITVSPRPLPILALGELAIERRVTKQARVAEESVDLRSRQARYVAKW